MTYMEKEIMACRDLEKALRYARIYALANRRQDILAACREAEGRYLSRAPGSSTEIRRGDGGTVGRLMLYAMASAGSCGPAADDVCRIVKKHCGLLDGEETALAAAVAGMLEDGDSEDCPFRGLREILEDEAAGADACGEGS